MRGEEMALVRTAAFEEVLLGPDGAYTTVTRVWLDAEPPVPPRVLSAAYDAAGEHVSLLFDRPLNVELGRWHPCSQYLLLDATGTERNAAVLPEGRECEAMWVSGVEMRVRVAARALHRAGRRALGPGRMLVFRDHTLRTLDSLNAAWLPGTAVEVGWPPESQRLRPAVNIDGPSLLPHGTPFLRLDLSRSTGSAGRPWVDAHFDFQSTAVELAPVLEAPLQAALNEAAVRVIKTGRLAFELPAGLLHEYTSYTLRFTLWNVFGDWATGQHVLSRAGPAAGIQGALPAVAIEGPSRVLRSEAVRLLALLPALLPDGRPYNASVAWSMLASPRPMRLRGATRPALIFERFALASGTYIASLRISIQPHAQPGEAVPMPMQIVQQHAFKVVAGPWAVRIGGGSRRVGAVDSLRLEAQPVDLAPRADTGGLPSADYDWSWSCSVGLERTGACMTRDGFLVELGSSTPSLSLPLALLPGGQTLVIGVTARHRGSREVRQHQVILEVDSRPAVPHLQIDAQPVRPSTASDEELRLRARLHANSTLLQPIRLYGDQQLQAHSGGEEVKRRVRFQWESMPVCAGKHYAVLPGIISPPVTVEIAAASPLEIVEQTASIPGALLIPGASYCFRISAKVLPDSHQDTSSTPVEGWAFAEVDVKAAPGSGYCDLESPAVGRAFESLFTVACHGWTADASTTGTLRYRFYRRTKKDLVPLAPGSQSARLQVPMEVGHASLEAHISDDHGVTTIVPIKAVRICFIFIFNFLIFFRCRRG